MYVVTMIDTFMSGWGPAEGKENIYAVHCATLEQAQQIEKAGQARDEMRKVKIHDKLPYYPEHSYVVSVKNFSELGPIWTGEVE